MPSDDTARQTQPRMTRRVLRGFSAQAFAEARRSSGISVSDLSRLANVAPATIFNWEAGKGSPQVDLLARVLRAIDVPMGQIVAVPRDERFPSDLRVIKGMTQPELAAAANIATTTLRGIERADAALTEANAAALASQLGISADEYRTAYQRARERPPGVSA